MELKNDDVKIMHEDSIIEKLQEKLDQIPLHLRGMVGFGFNFSEDDLDKNLESKYQFAQSRLTHLSFYLEWAYGLYQNDQTLPPETEMMKVQGLPCSFHDFDDIELEDLSVLNKSFSKWINNQLVRDLDEYLQAHLLVIYETCLVAQYAGRKILAKNFVEMRQAANKFEGSSLRERLRILRKEYAIDIEHKSEVYSLNKIRQIFAHFDGVVQKKFCDKNGVLKVTWPTNTVKFKNQKTGKLVLQEDIPKHSEDYRGMQITWFDQPKITTYRDKDCIELSHADLNQLIFFYLYIFNKLQYSLVEYVRQEGVRVRPFKEYAITPDICVISEEKEI